MLKLRINPRMHIDADGCTTKNIKVGGTIEKRLLSSQQFKIQPVLYWSFANAIVPGLKSVQASILQ